MVSITKLSYVLTSGFERGIGRSSFLLASLTRDLLLWRTTRQLRLRILLLVNLAVVAIGSEAPTPAWGVLRNMSSRQSSERCI